MGRERNILLYPLSLLYGPITALRNFMYNSGILKSREFSTPVICVGNLAVGGTGKTPHTEYLASILQKHFNVAVLSRGYKRKSHGFRFVTPGSTPEESGDEPLQIARKFPGITVAVDRNRVNGVQRILDDRPDMDVILLDDGFQHRKISPGYSILLSEFDRPFIRDHMLPYGNLRESRHNMRRADIILITKCPAGMTAIQRRIMVKEIGKPDYQNLYFTTFKYGMPVNVFDGTNPAEDILSPSGSENRGMVLVTGISNPGPLSSFLENRFGEVIHIPFRDHHSFSEKDIVKIQDAFLSLRSPSRYLITTEKDAVRLKEFANIAEQILSSAYYIPVETEFLNDDRDEFDNLIISYVRKNKRNDGVPEGKGIHRS